VDHHAGGEQRAEGHRRLRVPGAEDLLDALLLEGERDADAA
jgi:hypothetical protein